MVSQELRLRMILMVGLLMFVSSQVSADTWRLDKGQDWKTVSASPEDRYLLAVAEVKRLVNMGETEAVIQALEKLKEEFPEIVSPDLNAFLEAELLFSKGRFVKAVRAYDKFLAEYPQSELYDAALDREFSIGTAYLAGRKKSVLKVFKIRGYAEGAKIMDRISDRSGADTMGVKAALAVAKSLERRGKFEDAYQRWSEISLRWPTGETGKEALLSMARCKHAAYRGPDYDVSNLVSASSYYQNFRLRYPGDAEETGVDEKLKQIAEQLAYKHFGTAEYYQKTGNIQSANFYYQMVIDNWPDTTAAQMAEAAMKHKQPQDEKEEKWEKKTIKKLGDLFL